MTKLVVTVWVLLLLQASAHTFAQKITLNVKQASLKEVLDRIQKQTKYDFMYNADQLKAFPLITLNVSGAELTEVLDICFKEQDFTYVLDNNVVVIHKQDNSRVTDNHVQRFIQGRVVDENNTPIAGVTIRLKGNNARTFFSNKDGIFMIPIELDGSVIIVSHLGYLATEITVDIDRKPWIVVLSASETALDDVVITGYTQRTREQFTGAATVITRKDMEKFNNNNIFAIIQAIDPAFKLDENIQDGSNPNVLPQINIRGISSVGEYSVNAPLVILDGFEVALSRLYDLDVSRIETISILKDASATSLYGSRGGNGVIIIETRIPKEGKFTATYDARPSITLVDLSDYNLMDAAQKLEYERLAGIYQAFSTDASWQHLQQEAYDNLYALRQNNIQSGVNTYWLKQPVRSTASVAHSLRLEGGRDEVRYSLEGNYNDFKGVIKESGRNRAGGAFNLIYRIPNKFTFRNIASYQYTKAYNSPYGSFSEYTRLNPYERMLDDEGNPIIRFAELGEDYLSYTFGTQLFNPLYNAQLPTRNQALSNVLANNTFVEWFASNNFRIIGRGVITKSFSESETFLSPYHTNFYNIIEASRRGSYSISSGEGLQLDGNINLQYSNSLDKHQLIGNLIGEIRTVRRTEIRHLLTGFTDDRIISPSLALQYAENSLPTITSDPINSAGLVLSGLYAYDNRYNISANLRWDGSSIYGEHSRSKVFWTTGVRYNLHREKWFENRYVNFLSLYGNIGISGLENFRSDMALTTYRINQDGTYFRQNGSVYTSQGNPSIRWPEINQRSAGIEIAFLQNAFKIDASLYNNVTNDMVSSITVAPSLGFQGNRYTENLGKVSNKGFEIRTELRLYQSQENNFSWIAHLGLVQNRGKLLEISNELRLLNESLVVTDDDGNQIKPSTYYEEGQSLQIIRAVPSLGIDPASGRELFLDRNGNVTYTWNANDLQVVGNEEPDLFGNFGTTIGYRGFGATAIFRYSLGGDIYNQTLMDKIENNDPYVNADVRVLEERWREPGDQAKYKAINDLTVTQLSSRFVQQENFVALSSLNIFYEFPSALVSRYKLQRARLNFSSNDVFRASTVRMERGIDYPYARTYNFGLLVQF